jgi:hypothetical protein
VVEVVVTLTDGDEGGDEVVLGGVLVVEGSLTEPVRKRVDTEGRVVDKDKTSGTGEEESTPPVSPAETSDKSRDHESVKEEERKVVVVLPADDRVARKVRNVGDSNLSTGLNEHPSDVSPPEALVSRVGVKLGVGVTVVGAVSARPPLDGALNGAGSPVGEEVLKRLASVVRAVSPQTVVTSGNTETGEEVVDDTDNVSNEKTNVGSAIGSRLGPSATFGAANPV